VLVKNQGTVMARARNIKPGFFKNEVLGTQDPILMLLFAGLWTLADKRGRLEDRPLRIKAELFPYRVELDINRYLTDLERLGFIRRYSAGDLSIIQVLQFDKHQHPHHTEKESELPEYKDGSDITVKAPEINRLAPSDSLIPDSLIPSKPSRAKNRKSSIPTDFQPSEETKAWAVKKGFSEFLPAHLDYFRDYAASSGKVYADWDAAFRNCVKGDWGGVRKNYKPQGGARRLAI
jgi:hypothetical protein